MIDTLRNGLWFVALTALLSGCIGSRSATPDYHLLTARAPVNTAPSQSGVSIGVGPVHIAQFLDRPQIVTHSGGGTLQLNDSQRWAEPLEQGIQRALLQNFAALIGAETRNFPWRQNLTPDYAVRIDVTDLDRLGNGSALLEVSWVLEDLKNARVLKTQQEQLRATLGSGGNALAEAYSDLLAQLAQRIAAQLPNLEPTLQH
jgi:uncharacterized lipoprotein YmbA